VQVAAGEGFDRHTCRLAWALVPFLMRRGPTRALLATQPSAVRSAERLGDPEAQAHAHRGLGSAYIRLGRYAEADVELQRALEFYRQAGDVLGQALCHNNRVHLFNRPEHAQRLIDECAHALALYRAIGHREGEATTLANLGWGHSLLGDHRQAVASCEQAIAIFEEIGGRVDGACAAW
jgi:tetratricopeptide (TPR) repeat protein